MKLSDVRLGMGVVYRPSGGGKAEDGDVVGVNKLGMVMVRYVGDRLAKATRPEDLEPLNADWISDESGLAAEEKLERFEALGPTATASPGGDLRIAELEAALTEALDELDECRSFISVETRHYPTITAISETMEQVRFVLEGSASSPSPSGLLTLLLAEQHRRCAYRTREGDGRTCDCKYDMRPLRPATSETTGCPELRAAIRVLTEKKESTQ